MFKKTIPTLLAFAFIVLINHACAPLTPPESVQTKSEQGGILFADDFSDPPSGWGIWNKDGGMVEYLDGGLHIQVEDDYFDFWSVAGKSFSDVQIEVDALKRAGPDDNDFGMICRYLNKENFYMLVVSSDGYYGIAKVKEGQYSMIGMDQLQYSDAILPGNVSNHLRADCVGETLRLYANGLMLVEVHDSDFRSGDVGLVAGAYKETGVDILFDQFVVKITDN